MEGGGGGGSGTDLMMGGPDEVQGGPAKQRVASLRRPYDAAAAVS